MTQLLILLTLIACGVQGQDDTDEILDDEELLKQLDNTGEDIYDGLVANLYIGKGTLIVAIFGLIGALFCIFRNSSRFPNFCVCLGFLIPMGMYGILRQLPFESLESDETQADQQP